MTRPLIRAWSRAAGAAAALALLLCLAPAAGASSCPDCAASRSEIMVGADVVLGERFFNRDYFEYDAGDCIFSHTDTDGPRTVQSALELRASGEVWNCPESRSSSTISAEVGSEDRTDWSHTVSVEVELSGIAAAMKAKYSGTTGGGTTITEATDLTLSLEASFCHRIPWLAYLEVGVIQVSETYDLTQPYAWWTKNFLTFDKVHSSGTWTKSCGATTLTMRRKAPLRWTVRLGQKSCGAMCQQVLPADHGFRPKLPDYVAEPPIPEGIDWPEDEEEGESPDTTTDDPPARTDPDDPEGDDEPLSSGDLGPPPFEPLPMPGPEDLPEPGE